MPCVQNTCFVLRLASKEAHCIAVHALVRTHQLVTATARICRGGATVHVLCGARAGEMHVWTQCTPASWMHARFFLRSPVRMHARGDSSCFIMTGAYATRAFYPIFCARTREDAGACVEAFLPRHPTSPNGMAWTSWT